jgi:hypothetical protein
VPASTVRRLRLFHSWDVDTMAEAFRVSTRTVFRWEENGLDPGTLALDRNAHPNSGPDWRRKLLFFMLARLEAAGVSDNRKEVI